MAEKRAPLVVLISAWHENGTARGRVRHDLPGFEVEVICGSITDMADTVNALLAEWDGSKT